MNQSKTPAAAEKHSINIEQRNGGTVSGVSKVVSAYPDALNLITSCGALTINGKDLKILKFDVDEGCLRFEGELSALKYDAAKKPLLKRLFK